MTFAILAALSWCLPGVAWAGRGDFEDLERTINIVIALLIVGGVALVWLAVALYRRRRCHRCRTRESTPRLPTARIHR